MAEEQQRQLLIVEDERAMAHALELKFASEGFAVHTVYTGQEALDIVKYIQFDVMILDLMLPIEDGFTVLDKLGSHKPSTVVVLTNLAQPNDEDRARKLGADAYYVKTITPLATFVNEVKGM